jgi:hypothetical protein
MEKAMRVFVLVASSGAAATALTSAPDWAKLGFPLLALAGSFWLLFSRPNMLARDAADLHAGWNVVEAKYERLWNHLDEADAETIFNRIYDEANSLSKAGTKFPNKKKRLAYWLDQTAQIASAGYA